MTWNDYFMAMAIVASTKSKDPSSQVGAVIVDNDQRIVSAGFNGPPRGTDDEYGFADRDRKLLRVLHAEENAILFAGKSLKGCSLYVTHHPCAHCAAVIIQSGIKSVFHLPVSKEFDDRWHDNMIEARCMFAEAGVSRTVLVP